MKRLLVITLLWSPLLNAQIFYEITGRIDLLSHLRVVNIYGDGSIFSTSASGDPTETFELNETFTLTFAVDPNVAPEEGFEQTHWKFNESNSSPLLFNYSYGEYIGSSANYSFTVGLPFSEIWSVDINDGSDIHAFPALSGIEFDYLYLSLENFFYYTGVLQEGVLPVDVTLDDFENRKFIFGFERPFAELTQVGDIRSIDIEGTVDSLTITIIPEPQSNVLLTVLGVSLFIFWRRKKAFSN